MKKLLLACSCTLLLAVFGPIPSASASWWPWGHHHSKKADNAAPSSTSEAPAPSAKSSKPKKSRMPKFRHEKHQQPAGDHLYSVPNTVGWWHKGPGPAGAGS